MNEVSKLWDEFEAWVALLWHHKEAGTLPAAPPITGGNVSLPPVGVAPTPVPIVIIPGSAATEPELPAGVTWGDTVNRLVKLAALEQYYPGRLYAVKQAEDFSTPGTAGYFGIVQNVQNASFALANDMIYTQVYTCVANDLTNGFQLTKTVVPNGFSCPDKYPTFDSVIAWLTDIAKQNAANPDNKPGGGGFGPAH